MANDQIIRIKPKQKDPAVWVERFVIFDSVNPLTLIREIPFRRGVNVIWAAEQEGADDTTGPADVVGHSVGKTTLCRLIRYCLGEDRFGTDEGQKLIRHNIANGYVGAHIWVEGTRWGVARPIGDGNRHYAAPELSVEELLQNRTHANDYAQFTNALEQALLRPLKVKYNPRTGVPIEARQILAWCTRDQEAHYEDVWQWRSPRAGSAAIGLERPKVDAVFVMRVLLGLVAGDESEALKALKDSEAAREKAAIELAEARKEPEYWQRELTDRLYDGLKLKRDVPLDSGNLFNLDSVADHVTKFEKEANGEAGRYDKDIYAGFRDEDMIRRRRALVAEELKQAMDQLEQNDAAAEELKDGKEELDKNDDTELTDHWICDYSQKLVTTVECWRIYQERIHQDILSIDSAAEQKRDARQLNKRDAESNELRRRIGILTAEMKRLRLLLNAKSEQRVKMQRKRDEVLRNASRYTESLSELREWNKVLEGEKPNLKLDRAREVVAECEIEYSRVRENVRDLLKSHQQGQENLRLLFQRVIKAVISNKYSGKITLAEEDLRFEITRGPALGGEAVNILSVLLADVTALIASIEGTAFLPRFLMHDSPRESDLARHLYWKLLLVLQGLEVTAQQEYPPPFQYIVTTTTPPPEKMRKRPPVQCELNASSKDGLLLRKMLTLDPPLPIVEEP